VSPPGTGTVALLTASRPDRSAMLAEQLATVAAQTVRPDVHLVGVDHPGQGPAEILNGLAARAPATTWVAFCDDDDLLEPTHLEVLLGASGGIARGEPLDVVHSAWFTSGRDGWGWDEVHDPGTCSLVTPERNTVPSCALVRREAFLAVGGFPATRPHDWALWLELKAAGAAFGCVHQPTWTYRWHGDNRSAEIEGQGLVTP
jgi:hypothetical protein